MIDWRTDQFALGITLSFLFFGIHPFQHEGFSIERTVDEVADHGQFSELFIQKIKDYSMHTLQKMTNVWPAKRYRTPDTLSKSWIDQGR